MCCFCYFISLQLHGRNYIQINDFFLACYIYLFSLHSFLWLRKNKWKGFFDNYEFLFFLFILIIRLLNCIRGWLKALNTKKKNIKLLKISMIMKKERNWILERKIMYLLMDCWSTLRSSLCYYSFGINDFFMFYVYTKKIFTWNSNLILSIIFGSL